MPVPPLSKQISRIVYDSVLHPFLFSIFFILRGLYEVQLYASVVEAAGLVFLAILVSFAAVKILQLPLRNKIKAGILASIGLLMLLYFGEIRNELKQHGFTEIARYRYLFAMGVFLPGIMAAFLFRTKRSLTNVNACINLISILYVLIEVFHIFIYVPKNAVSIKQESDTNRKVAETSFRRDIYYLLFDSYTSNTSLKELWKFDNAGITDYLITKNFYVAENSRSNYNVTPYSLASSLNLSYLSVSEDSDLNLTMRVLPLRELIRTSIVVQKLQTAGYEIMNLSPFSLFNEPEFYTSKDLPDSNYVLPRHLLRKTFIGAMDTDFFVRIQPETIFRIDRSLKEIIASSGTKPRFIYAHFMLPRSPYVFTKEGSVKPSDQWRVSDETARSAGYLDQVVFSNQIIFNLIEEMSDRYKPDEFPVVIIQGDHGSWVFDGDKGKRETTTIFNAYFLPDQGERLLYNNITPVNSFRVLFNHCFSTEYKLLEDQIFEVDTSYIPRLSQP